MKNGGNKLCAFISYQTSDKQIAGKMKDILSIYNIDSFLAHEDIDVSEEWREEILKYLKKSSIFICILSKNYLESSYCMQESGIAVIKNMTIISLSLDGTTPPGFISKYQSKKIDPVRLTIHDIIPGLMKMEKNERIKLLIDIIGDSKSYREAERNYEYILPDLDELNDKQAEDLLDKVLYNGQINGAHKCFSDYIPRTIKEYGYLLTKGQYNRLKEHYKLMGAENLLPRYPAQIEST